MGMKDVGGGWENRMNGYISQDLPSTPKSAEVKYSPAHFSVSTREYEICLTVAYLELGR